MTPVAEIPEIKVNRPLNPDATTIRELVEDSEIGEAIDVTTDHAWLVVLGLFAQTLGLIAKLEEVHLDQRQGPNGPPQTKLIEFLVGILGGIDYLQDINKAPQPIALDEELAEAWVQDIFSHYSQVSRTLDAADEQTQQEVLEVLRTISEPYIQQAVMETLQKQDFLLIDLDLTGRPVSPQSTDYLDADFGWMDDGVQKGYQAAITSLVCERWQRLMLTCQRYSGRTSSADCLQQAVSEVEKLLGIRPRRRTELLLASRRQMMAKQDKLQKSLEKKQAKERILWQQMDQTSQEIKELRVEVTELVEQYQAKGWIQKRYCRLAKARRKLDSAIKREARLWRYGQIVSRQKLSILNKISQQQEAMMELDERLADLETDNCANPNPIKITLRIDAGFSTGKNLTWLIEMGYTVLPGAHHSQTSHSLLNKLSPNDCWTVVGKNADAYYVPDYYQNNCPYPLQAMLTRYHLPEKKRYTTLFYVDRNTSSPLARLVFAL